MNRKAIIATIAVVILAGMATLYFFVDPSASILMPKCPIKFMTGFDCPSCGIQRMFHALLHGEFLKAVMINPFLIIAIPYAAAVAYTTFSKSRLSERLFPYVQHHHTIIAFMVIYFTWWILRNLPPIKAFFESYYL